MTWSILRKKECSGLCQRFGNAYLIAVSCSYLMRRLFPERFRGHKLSFPSMARLRWRGRRAFIHQRCCAESSSTNVHCQAFHFCASETRQQMASVRGEWKWNQKQLIIPKSVNSKYPWVKGMKKNERKGGQLEAEEAASVGVQLCCNNKSKS